MNNLMRLGAVMKYLYAICFCVLPIYVMLFWITNGFPLGAGTPMQVFLYEGPTLPAISTFPVSVKIIAFLINMIPVSLYMLLLGFLIRLFHCFSRGEILSLRIVKYIRYAAWTFLGAQLIRPIYSFLMSLLVSHLHLPHFRYAYIGINLQDIVMISISTTVLLISWVFAEYYKIHQEQEFTV